jgi:predicted ABC-type ATPase
MISSQLELVRHVRTPAGEKFFGEPIGSPIVGGRHKSSKLPWHTEGDALKYHGSLGIPREQTPQFSGQIGGKYVGPDVAIPAFRKWLGQRGIGTTEDRVDTATLKPIKASGSWKAVRGIANELKSGKRQDTKPVFVSSDGYVIDGTQTWAAKRLADSEGGRPGLAHGIPIVKANMPASELLPTARKWMDEYGMPTRAAGEIADPTYIARENAEKASQASGFHDSLEEHKDDPERKKLHDQIVARALAGHQPQAHPIATFLGGGPASGKGTVLAGLQGDSAHIDADEIKKQLPEYQSMTRAGDLGAANYVHEESSVISKRIMREAAQRKLNFTLDGTGDSSYEKMKGKIDAARLHGHLVVGKYVTIPTDEAVARAKLRAAETSRLVPETVIRHTHAAVSQVFEQAVRNNDFDALELWDNNGPSSQPAKLIASKALGGKFAVHDPVAYQAFLDKGRETA